MNSITEDDVIHDSDSVTIDSLLGVETVHLYLLCSGAPLPKEFPGVHRRLAKRDTQVNPVLIALACLLFRLPLAASWHTRGAGGGGGGIQVRARVTAGLCRGT